MGKDLKARLGRYRATAKTSAAREAVPHSPENHSAPLENLQSKWLGWTEAGFNILKRELSCDLSFPLPCAFPKTMPILVPDFLRLRRFPSPEELLFFDLETTGLSGGAGTIAFLAAFGRFVISKKDRCSFARLLITQYLLLDYPGENDFVEKVVSELNPAGSTAQPIVVSFNGKSFDSQIIKNRCLMNRIRPPEYLHADLLHPARRLWKKILPDCSQTTIEVSVLDLDRTGDIPGAMAPDIWFSLLKTDENQELLRVCDHNAKDISGLASLFLALAEIAADPLESRARFRFNEEALSLSWWKALRNYPDFFGGIEPHQNYEKTGELLLENAARNGSPLAALVLAKKAEWQLRDVKKALEYTGLALANQQISESFREELKRRYSRLEGKL